MTISHSIKKLYYDSLWIRFFTWVRFWTGSFVELEKYVPKKGLILDLGCGYGIFANYLARTSSKRSIIGVDMDVQKIEHADKGFLNVEFRLGDATEMKFSNLDAIILHDVLHHLDSYQQQEKLIADCSTMLKKGGVLLIVEVDNKPYLTLVFARITDFIMYKGQPVYYRYKTEMEKLLSQYFPKKQIQTEILENNPFPQVVYLCKK